MQDVIVYSKNYCPACRQTELALDRAGIEFEHASLGDLGVEESEYKQAPVVKFRNWTWCGHRPLLLDQLARYSRGDLTLGQFSRFADNWCRIKT